MSLFSPETVAEVETLKRPSLRHESGGLIVEMLDLETMSAHSAAWSDLSSRALEPDVFMEPAFALAAARHLPPIRRPGFLAVWAPDSEGGSRLIGLCLTTMPRNRLGLRCAAAWSHEQAVMSAPMLDKVSAADALRAVLDWLDRSQWACGRLLLRGVPLTGPWQDLLASRGLFRAAVIETRKRAILSRAIAEQGRAEGSRRLKELRRLQRRLSEQGTLTYSSAREPTDVRFATERFLELEARGWKGERRTALLLDPDRVTFARTMTRLLARSAQCQIDSLELDGAPIAMGIVLRSQDRAYFWKTSFDEDFSAFSPGKQFAAMLTERLLRDDRIRLVDSCAMPNHPMIDRIWPERMDVVDVLVGLSQVAPGAFGRTAGTLSAAARGRRFAKDMVNRSRGALTKGRPAAA